MTRSYVIVALQNSIHGYIVSQPPQSLSVFETADNPLGLCCIGSKVLAFPGRTPGQVQVVELATGNISIIPAHSTPLQALALSQDEEILATASETGTLVRTFSTSNCVRTAELRRGVDRADIYSIGISPNSKYLAVTSDKGTLHIFDLPNYGTPQNGLHTSQSHRNSTHSSSSAPEEPESHKWGILGKLPLMPRVFSDVYSFTSAHFATDDDSPSPFGTATNKPIPGIRGGKARKGIIGWKDDSSIFVIGAGRDGRCERFFLGDSANGKRHLIRTGWKRYLGS